VQVVSRWRQRALQTFPELKREVSDKKEIGSTYDLWTFYLYSMVREAHARGDRDMLQPIYGYAAWSSRQPAKNVWNAVGVSFYEHLFDRHQKEEWIDEVAGWIPSDVVRRVWPLWESGPHAMSPVDLARLRKALDVRGGIISSRRS
jgi:hypothetical protein